MVTDLLNIDNRYPAQTTQLRIQEVALRIIQYDRRVDMIQVLVGKLLTRYADQPPTSRTWVVIDGQRQVAWSMRSPSDHSDDNISLLPDGRLVLLKANNTNRSNVYAVEGVITLRPAKDHDPKYAYGSYVTLEALTSLCRNMIGIARAQDISIDSSWDRFSHPDWDGSDKPPRRPNESFWLKAWRMINHDHTSTWHDRPSNTVARPPQRLV